MEFSIGICAYNEEKNIGILLDSIINQKTNHNLQEIIVVSSGCKDKTEEIIEELAKKDKRITLLVEKERKGKPSAINKILKKNKSNFLILTDGDTIPAENSFDALLDSFTDRIGAVSSKIIPLDEKNIFWDYVGKTRYKMYNKICLDEQKKDRFFHTTGYLYAIKKDIVKEIPNILNDDGYIGSMIYKKKWKLKYQPKAIIYIRHPNNIKDFISQRKRVRLAHLQLVEITKIDMASTKLSNISLAFLTNIGKNPLKWLFIPLMIVLEAYSLILAKKEYKKGVSTIKNWESLESPKRLK